MSQMRTSTANPIRTAIQLAPAAVITEFSDAFIHDFNDRQYAALLGLLTLVISFVQNKIEERKGKALLK